MQAFLRNILIGLLVVMAGQAMAQPDKPALPRVLIIGDSIYTQQGRPVSGDMKDRAQVVIATMPGSRITNSSTVIEQLDVLLGYSDREGKPLLEDKRPSWDLIHFNAGLGDLIYCVPNIQSHRVQAHNAGGVIRTDAQQYEKNLDTLVRLLKQKAPGAKLIWASTTPIRASRDSVFKPGEEVEYNAIAARVMNQHGVPINDMHHYVRHLIDMNKPAGHGADPFDFEKKPIHMPIVRVIEQSFGLAPMAETEQEKAVKQAAAQAPPAQG